MNATLRARTRKGRGLTLVETLIAATILIATIMAAMSLLISTSDDVGETLAVSQLVIDADTLERRIREELTGAGNVEIWDRGLVGTPPAPITNKLTCIRYRRPSGYNFGTQVTNYGSLREIRLELDEPVNNIDDNQNGLIDEGRLVVYDNGVAQAQIGRNVATGPETYVLGATRGLRADQQYLTAADPGAPPDGGGKPEELRWLFSDGAGGVGPTAPGGVRTSSQTQLFFTFVLLARGPAVRGTSQVFAQRRTVAIAFRNTW